LNEFKVEQKPNPPNKMFNRLNKLILDNESDELK